VASVDVISPMGITLARFTSRDLGTVFDVEPGLTTVLFTIESVPFLDGRHQLNVGVSADHEGGPFVWLERAAVLEMTYSGKVEGLIDVAATVRVC
jgi:hypothetical protein